jgi:hypothetical protein
MCANARGGKSGAAVRAELWGYGTNDVRTDSVQGACANFFRAWISRVYPRSAALDLSVYGEKAGVEGVDKFLRCDAEDETEFHENKFFNPVIRRE